MHRPYFRAAPTSISYTAEALSRGTTAHCIAVSSILPFVIWLFSAFNQRFAAPFKVNAHLLAFFAAWRPPKAVVLAGSLLFVLSTPSAKAQTEGLFSPPPTVGISSETLFVSPSESTQRLDDNIDKVPGGLDIPDTVDLEAGGQTIRRRMARIDLAYLGKAQRAVKAGHAARLGLNLFGDSGFRAVDLRVAPTITGYSISGRLDGVPFGTATLVVNGDVVAGSVRVPGHTFSIRSVGSGHVEIREVDPSKLPPGGEPVVLPPSAVRSAPAKEAAAEDQDEKVIDVLVVYTPVAREAAGALRSRRSSTFG